MAVTFTYDETKAGPFNVVIGTFVSDGSGDAVGTCKPISGEIVRVVTDPGAAAPTANWDLVITDNHGLDITALSDASLINRHTTTTEQVIPILDAAAGGEAGARIFPVVVGALTFTVSNAGDTKGGVIYVYWDAGSR
jgi:hypothetical protein